MEETAIEDPVLESYARLGDDAVRAGLTRVAGF